MAAPGRTPVERNANVRRLGEGMMIRLRAMTHEEH